jgi:hypothetical protein
MGEALKESRVAATPYPAYEVLMVGPVSEAPPGKRGAVRSDLCGLMPSPQPSPTGRGCKH